MVYEKGPKARVQGEGNRNGRSTDDIPDGYIDWEEHYRAWDGYSRRHRGQSAEQIEERGGFSYRELKRFLGHNPETWVLRDPGRYKLFVLAPDDQPMSETATDEPAPIELSHIWYASGTVKICDEQIGVPESPIYFDVTDAHYCNQCMTQLVKWIEWWTGEDKSSWVTTT